MYCCTLATIYSVSIFAPTIISQLQPGQTPRHAQVLVVPIFATASVGSLTAAYASVKLQHRAGFAVFGYCLSIVGSSILVDQARYDTASRYAALFLMATGGYISLPMLWTMLASNVIGSYKIGFAVALEVGLGNLGGIASALVFQGKQAPEYSEGYRALIIMSCLAAGLVVVYTTLLFLENRARDAGMRDHRLLGADADQLGDRHPSFRFRY